MLDTYTDGDDQRNGSDRHVLTHTYVALLRLALCVWNAFTLLSAGVAAYLLRSTDIGDGWSIWICVGVAIVASLWGTWRLALLLVLACEEAIDYRGGFGGGGGGSSMAPADPLSFDDLQARDRRASSVVPDLNRTQRLAANTHERVFRGVYMCHETVVVLKGFDPVVLDEGYDTVGYTTAMCAALEGIESICSLNNGRIDACTGASLTLSFSSTHAGSEGVRSAYYCTHLNLGQTGTDFVLKAGVRGGDVMRGRVGSRSCMWDVSTAGARTVADLLCSANDAFQTLVLFAGVVNETLMGLFRFAQVDFLDFNTGQGVERLQVYSVDEGKGLDADLTVLWLHFQGDEVTKAQEMLEKLDAGDNDTHVVSALQARVAAILMFDTTSYRANLGVTSLPCMEARALRRDLKKVGNGKGRKLPESHERRAVFLVMQLGGLTKNKLREALAMFSMGVERHNGEVESLLSDLLIARWCVSASASDAVRCAVHLRKIFTLWDCGFGLCVGQVECFLHRDSSIFLSSARARAECLAMLSLVHNLYIVSDIETQAMCSVSAIERRRRRVSAGSTTESQVDLRWRPLCYDGSFQLPYDVMLTGLSELREVSDSQQHALYLRAMSQISDRMWGNARELLQQYNDTVELDRWAMLLHRVVCQVVIEEQEGLRSSDDALLIIVNKAGGRFELSSGAPDVNRVNVARRTSSRVEEAFVRTLTRNSTVTASGSPLRAASPSFHGGVLESRSRSLGPVSPAHHYHQHHQKRPATVSFQNREFVRLNLGFHGKDNRNSNLEKNATRKTDLGFVFGVFSGCRLVAMLVECIITPTWLFGRSSDPDDAALGVILTVWVICDVVSIVDTVSNFFETATTETGILVTNRPDLARMYARGWLLPDLIACLPWEVLWIPFQPDVVTTHHWVRANRLVGIFRIQSKILCVQERFFPDLHPVGVKVCSHILILMYVLFWMACLWQTGNTTLDPEYFLVPEFDGLTLFEQQLIRFHWAVRGFAGYGQRWPQTDRQHAMCLVNVVIGIGIFATVIAYLQNAMKMTHNAVFLNRLDSIVAVSEHRRLDRSTTAEILRYHRMLWAKTKQVYDGQFTDLLVELPDELVGELTYFANIKAIEKVNVFKQATNPLFVTKIVSRLSMRFGNPGEMIFERGEPINHRVSGVYFFYRGAATASVDGALLEHVTEGEFWGEIPCLLGVPQPADLRITSYAEMFFLPLDGFKLIMREFPEYASFFLTVATRRREHIRAVISDNTSDKKGWVWGHAQSRTHTHTHTHCPCHCNADRQ